MSDFTHLVSLWLDNDEGLQESCLDIARRHRDSRYDTADAIREMVESDMSHDRDRLNHIMAHLLNAALGAVDWYDIADGFIAMIKEECK